MGLDYESHPAELIGSGHVGQKKIEVKQLRDAIPKHCFEPSWSYALYYLARDLTYAFTFATAAYKLIPYIPNVWGRTAAWMAYGVVQGWVFTGFWVLGHECGHGAFSKSDLFNNTVGLVLHSFLMTPFFAWRSTHRRHHIYANNMVKDHNYVPQYKEDYMTALFANKLGIDAEKFEDITEDAPIVTFLRIFVQQLVGFPYYLLTNASAAPTSLPGGQEASKTFLGNSHFAPSGVLFRPEEFWVMLLSDIGMIANAVCLYKIGTVLGHQNMMLLYMVPYMWVNHWLVAITYLHHTHPSLPKYDNEAWSFIRGATATIDRHLSFIGTHFMHNILDFHVIHHLFSRIPFYHGPEATEAVIPLLGDAYHSDKENAFMGGLWQSFTECAWVECVNPEAPKKDQVLYYRYGQSGKTKEPAKGWSEALSTLTNFASKQGPSHVKVA